jgi:2',3'-cyclic-nucleotide 2'-phosphodiesterase (5'-nucleotidase family)
LTPKRQSPAYSSGIQFTDPSINAAKYVRILRDYEQCAMVFMVTHMGLAQQVDLANKPYVEGVDYILGADTHERVRKPIEGKYSKVTEPGAFGSFVAKLDIVVENGIVKEHHYNLMDVDPEMYKPDAEMLSLVEAAKAPYRKELETVIGSTKTTLVRYYVMETPMDNLITDALMWKLKPDIALSNGFRFCPPLVPDPKTGMATITNDYLWSMLPVNSEAKWAQVTGTQLKQWLEKELENVFAKDPTKRFGGWVVRFKGMEVNFTADKPKGERVNWIKIKGKKMEAAKLYSVIACDREGDPVDTLCRIEKVLNPKLLGLNLHDIMREYLKKFSPVSPKVEGRIHCTDKPIDLLSQLEGYDYDFV